MAEEAQDVDTKKLYRQIEIAMAEMMICMDPLDKVPGIETDNILKQAELRLENEGIPSGYFQNSFIGEAFINEWKYVADVRQLYSAEGFVKGVNFLVMVDTSGRWTFKLRQNTIRGVQDVGKLPVSINSMDEFKRVVIDILECNFWTLNNLSLQVI